LNTNGNKLVVFSGIALYNGDKYIPRNAADEYIVTTLCSRPIV